MSNFAHNSDYRFGILLENQLYAVAMVTNLSLKTNVTIGC